MERRTGGGDASGQSRIFWRKNDPGSGGDRPNEKTFIGSSLEELAAPPPQPAPIRELFLRHYDTIRAWCEKEKRPGVVLVAMEATSVHGAAFLAFKPDTISTAILGRHTRADLRLEADPSVSLRHLVLLLFPRPAYAQRGRYRLLDLRTATGFVDERGKRLRAIEAAGPAFVYLGGYALLLFPVSGADPPWPEDAEEGWSRVPDRLYLDEVEGEERSFEWERDSDRAWEADALPALREAPTLVHNVAGPEIAVHELLAEGDEPLGELQIASPRGLATVVLGGRAAGSGVLLGRSRRCDTGRVLSDRSISRVHLLVIEIAGSLYAIDTASSNGVFLGEEQEQVLPLDGTRKFLLGDLATVSWRPIGKET